MAKYKQIGIDVEVYRAIEANRVSFSESENDILRRMIVGSTTQRLRKGSVSESVFAQGTRNRGSWTVTIAGKQTQVGSLSAAYQRLLLGLAERDTNFLERFSKIRGRTRRFVAKQPEALYENSVHLAADFAKPLIDGWYFDTNLSLQQIAQRAKAAAEVSGLRYGVEVMIAKDGELI